MALVDIHVSSLLQILEWVVGSFYGIPTFRRRHSCNSESGRPAINAAEVDFARRGSCGNLGLSQVLLYRCSVFIGMEPIHSLSPSACSRCSQSLLRTPSSHRLSTEGTVCVRG